MVFHQVVFSRMTRALTCKARKKVHSMMFALLLPLYFD